MQVKQVKVTKRLSDSPAIVTDHESGALRRMMKMVVRIKYHLFSYLIFSLNLYIFSAKVFLR